MFTRVRPPQHKQPVCGFTQPLCVLFDLKTLLKTPFRAPCSPGPAPYNTNNHSVSTHNHCVGYWTSKHHWKSIYRAPYSPGPTHKNTNNHFVGTLNHCVGLLTSKHYWNTPIRAMFIRSSPSTTQTKTVWAHTNTLWVSSRQLTNGKQLIQPRVYHSLLPTTQTTR